MNNLYRLSRYLWPYSSRMIAAVAAMFGVAIATVGIISLLGPILDGGFLQPIEVIEGLSVDETLQTSVTTEDLLRLAGSLVILYVLLGIARFLSAYLMGAVGFSMVRDLRCDLFRHLELLPLDFHSQHSTGGLMSRVTADVLAVQSDVLLKPAHAPHSRSCDHT